MKRLLVLICIALVTGASSSKQLSWVAVGDSITYLNDHLDETGYRVTKGYMTRVTEDLPAIKYVNKGYNGWTSGGIADEIEKLGLGSADVYSVFLGTNDWWQGRPVGTLNDYKNNMGSATLFGAYRIIIDKLKSLNKDAQIMLITPMQRGDFVYIANNKNNAYGSYNEKNGQTLAQFAAAIIAIGTYENAVVIDLYSDSGITVDNTVKYKRLKDPNTGAYREYNYPDFIDIPFNPETDEYPYPVGAIDMTFDGLHPSDRGNEIIANMIEKVIRK
jgi:lysophospholipase L1-like esterase